MVVVGNSIRLVKLLQAIMSSQFDALKDIAQDATSTTIRNDGDHLKFCPSCAQVMRKLRVCDRVKK